ncbi:MAG: hypothetical protein IKE01_05550 [Clostridia bacterium]|nr:hypothetical protein [Clostridia bacterium]
MKKGIIIGFVVILMVVAIAVFGYFRVLATEQNKVEGAIAEIFTSLKSNDDNSQKQEVMEQIDNVFNSENSTKSTMDEIGIFDKLNYSIIESKVNFNEANVYLDITNKDMKKILENYLTKALKIAIENAFNEDYSEEQMNEELRNYLKSQIESDEVENITTKITLNMEKRDGKWVIKEECKKDLINAVLPGLADVNNRINESISQNAN